MDFAVSSVASASFSRDPGFCLPAPILEPSPFFSVTGGLAQAVYGWLVEESTLAKLCVSIFTRFGKSLARWRRTVARRFAGRSRFVRSMYKGGVVCLRL